MSADEVRAAAQQLVNQGAQAVAVIFINAYANAANERAAIAAVRDILRDASRAPELHDYIRDAREQYGMQTLDQHLLDLVAEEVVTYETALAAARPSVDFELQMRTLRRRARVTEPAAVQSSAPRKR